MQSDTLLQAPVVVDTTDARADIDPPAPEVDTTSASMSEATSEALGTVEGFLNSFYEAIPRLAVAILVFLAFMLLARMLRSLVHRVTPGPTTEPIGQVLGRLTYAGIILLGFLVSLVVLFPTFTVASLVGALGIGGVAIGFAFQDIFQNLLAGILILLRQPFRVGDEITSGEYTGTVEAIETRATFIRTYDGKRVIVPNAKIYSDPVTVITAYNMVRGEYDIGIGYGDDIETAKQIALATMQGVEGVLKDPAPDVLTWDLAGSSVNLRIRWWTDATRSNVVQVKDRVLQRITSAMAEGAIDLPFPTQVILFHDQTEETDGDRTRQREGWPAPKDGPAPRPARLVRDRAEGRPPQNAAPTPNEGTA